MASVDVLRALLSPTSLPPELIEEFLHETNALWRFGVPDELVAGEAVLCHPPLAPDEVRATVEPRQGGAGWRITVVTADRPGLLAGTAGALASLRLSVTDAAVTVLPTSRLALQRLIAVPLDLRSFEDDDWQRVGRLLRASVGRAEPVEVDFQGRTPVTVDVQPQGRDRVMVTVDAPDAPGLLWAAADWFVAQGCNVEACRAGTAAGRARDVFVVSGAVDPDGLTVRLGGRPIRPGAVARLSTWPLSLGLALLRRVTSLLSRHPDR